MSKTEEQDASGFFQRPAFNAYERLICSHLIEAGKSEQPLQTVIHTTLAALALDDPTSKKLEIDRVQAESLYTVAQRLQNVTIDKDNTDSQVFRIELGTLNFDTDIKPWTRLVGYRHIIPHNESLEADRELSKKSEKRYFHRSNQRLTASGFQNLVSDFLLYSVPIVQNMSRKLSTLISPETFTELLKVYRGERVES